MAYNICITLEHRTDKDRGDHSYSPVSKEIFLLKQAGNMHSVTIDVGSSLIQTYKTGDRCVFRGFQEDEPREMEWIVIEFILSTEKRYV